MADHHFALRIGFDRIHVKIGRDYITRTHPGCGDEIETINPLGRGLDSYGFI